LQSKSRFPACSEFPDISMTDSPPPTPGAYLPLPDSINLRRAEAASFTSQDYQEDASPIPSEATTPRQGPRQPRKIPLDDVSMPKATKQPRPASSLPTKLVIPTPKQPSKCPLFCCFYAEFDNKVGPKVSYQSPRNFMNQEIDLPMEKIHSILEETFARFLDSPPSIPTSTTEPPDQSGSTTSDPVTTGSRRRRGSEASGQRPQVEPSSLVNESLLSSSAHPTAPVACRPDEDNDTDEPVNIPDGSLSIFDSCSEYSITGSELSGKIVNLSTHHIHVLTRPTMISNQRYERNSLLFCLGFVLRRTEDPRPFRPVLSKIADTLRDMEVESQFLSKNKDNNTQLQNLLEWTLVSLNSSKWECNLYLDPANVLNLKLFHAPKRLAPPVVDYAVPIFLRRDWQVQSFEFDLSINWVSLHIDGITNARKISKKAEVDMEIVQACLRVLLHHDVIALVDMFFYSNRYESTEKAASLLTGKDSKLLHDAVDFVMRRPAVSGSNGEASPTNSPSENHLSSSRFGPSSFSHADIHILPSHRRLEYHDVKIAVAELYVACHRGVSIGDLWIALVSGDLPPGMPATVNWKKMFQLIDHRRFTSFGMVHGLLKRVHDYPMLIDNSFGKESAGNLTQHYFLDREGVQPFSRVQEDERILRRRVAAAMDGRHCEDDLVCTFERPYEDLLALFPVNKIVHLFATEPPL
jgi:hypothetical protein